MWTSSLIIVKEPLRNIYTADLFQISRLSQLLIHTGKYKWKEDLEADKYKRLAQLPEVTGGFAFIKRVILILISVL
jgi:hypothetical protein